MLWLSDALGTRTLLLFWAWMLWLPHALGTRTLLWFEHGCSGSRTHSEHERYYGLGMDAILCLSYALGTRTLYILWFEHGSSGYRMHWEHESYCGLGMHALVIVCSGNTRVIMVWAWMLSGPYALGTRTLFWFGHGCSGYRMHSEHERYYPPPPTPPPNAKLRNLAKQGTEIPPVAETCPCLPALLPGTSVRSEHNHVREQGRMSRTPYPKLYIPALNLGSAHGTV